MSRLAPLLVALLLAGCRSTPPARPVPERIPAPDPAEVERVLFLVGDPGDSRDETHPLMPRLQQDIEWWSAQLKRDSAVAVIVLGDMIYPLGLHQPGTEEFPGDTAVLMDQVRLVAGPAARAARTPLFFLAGNHDWGLKEEAAGFVRLLTLDHFLSTARVLTGANAHLVPEAGTGGPFVLDFGRHARILMLDTAWWLLQAQDEEKNRVLEGVEEAMRTAGGRRILFAAHHPFKTAGPHGGSVSIWRTLGLQYLLTRSGAILQDLTSVPYRRLERGLRAIFERTGPPLAFAGGHEHSLQVIEGVLPGDPRYTLVSGSATKISEVGEVEGLEFKRAANGYMRLVILRSGEMSVYVEAGPEKKLVCPARGPEHEPCMQQGMAAIQTVHSRRLRP